MIDLSQKPEGQLGNGLWFSSLMLSAIQDEFTGVVLLRTLNGDQVVFFRAGQPVLASGPGFREHWLGQILVARGQCAQQQVDRALAEQQGAAGARPLLGALLVRDGVDPNEVKRAIQAQTHARLGIALELEAATWQAAPGEDQRVREIGVPIDAWAAFFDLMQSRTGAAERSHLTETFLGQAVRIKLGPLPQRAWTPEERKLLTYLEKPRKPDHLERAIGAGKRKMVQGFLRTLALMDRLELVSVRAAIAIPKAVKIQGVVAAPPINGASATIGARVIDSDLGSSKGDVIRPRRPGKLNPLVAEIKTFHRKMANQNHFEVLGVDEDLDTDDLRRKVMELNKKFHADALPTELKRDAELTRKAHEVAARINDAYEVLGDDKRLREYKALLRDERVKGDYRKLERIRDAEVKFEMGRAHFRKGEFDKARAMFKVAHENDPSSGKYQAHLAWATYRDPHLERGAHIDRVYEMLMEALKKTEDEADIHRFLGEVLKSKDRPKDALHHFKKVVHLLPKDTDAAREIRILEKRLSQSNGPKSSGLGRFFGRRDKK